MRYRPPSAAFVALALMAGLCATAFGETRLSVELGWGEQIRNDRWVPVLVTAWDDKPRNVVLDVDWPTGGTYSMHIQQAMTIDVKPRVFRLLVPVRGWAYQQGSFALSDRETGKTLAHYPKEPGTYLPTSRSYLPGPFFGISGAKAELGTLQVAITGVTTAFLEPRRIPDVALGYDSVDVLVLNAPNLVRSNFGPIELSDAQQQAIVDWIRAGGKLIIWPGEWGFPSSSPLVDVLPAHVGERGTIDLSDEDLTAIGLPHGLKRLASYHLDPIAGAEKRPLLNAGQAAAYSCRLGLGRIVLVPINIAELPIDKAPQCIDLWQPLTKDLLAANTTTGDSEREDTRDADQRENYASMQIADFLGNVPGAARIGFNYIAILLIGMMTIVGPVDWFVLKKLGRQPWTWVTTSGWVALVTVGALYAGHLFKSGNLDFKTIRTVDQIDNATVATSDYVSLYSSRTRSYSIKTPADTWWQPAGTSESGNSGLTLDIDFHQTSEGNTPQEMAVNVWSLRFLRGDKIGSGPPIIAADLKIGPAHGDGSKRHITGTLSNLTSEPLKNVRVSVERGSEVLTLYSQPSGWPTALPPLPVIVQEIAPHATVSVEAKIVAGSSAVTKESDDPYQRYPSMRYQYYNAKPPEESNLWKTASDMNFRRVRQMESLAATGKFALIFAETDHAAPVATLEGPAAVERHFEFVRALVELH